MRTVAGLPGPAIDKGHGAPPGVPRPNMARPPPFAYTGHIAYYNEVPTLTHSRGKQVHTLDGGSIYDYDKQRWTTIQPSTDALLNSQVGDKRRGSVDPGQPFAMSGTFQTPDGVKYDIDKTGTRYRNHL